MKTYNYKIINDPIHKIIDFDLFKNEQNVLIQIFCGQGKSKYQKTLDELNQHLPNALCIGSTTDGEIYQDEVCTKSIILSISVFKQTSLISASSKKEDSFERGVDLASKLVTKNSKLLILFSNSLGVNAEEFLKGVSSINKNVLVCGGLASDNGGFFETYVSNNNEIINNGVVGVSLNSDILTVENDYRFNWSSIGVEHPITKAQKNRIYEINGIKTADFYKKYLGDDILNTIPESASSFPLLVKNKNEFIARALMKINDDGSFEYTGNFKENDKIKFGFGNAELILKHPIIPNEKDYSNSESFFIYSCMARRRYVPDLIYTENEAFSNIAPTSGFFTYGEFFHKNGQNILLNQTMTVVSLSESNTQKNNILEVESAKTIPSSNKYTKTIQTLTHLVEQSSKDYDKQSMNLEVEKINSQMLLTSQKIFLRHAVHETNTPISVIMSNIELFEMEYGKNPYLSTIEVALKNIFNIYDDLSYLVKKDQVEYPQKNIDLVDFIRSRIEFFEQSAQQIGSQIKFFSDRESLMFNFNETKLQRVIDNNLTNAIKYTEENSNIYITLKQEFDAYALVISSCSQYIQYPEKIFKEYYREESTKKGFGLGLSLVKRICDEENIKVSIDSNEYFTSFRYLFKIQEQS